MNFFIDYQKNKKKANLIADNGAVTDYNNIIVKENTITERVYIVDADNEDQEFVSLPLPVTIIMTNYETE